MKYRYKFKGKQIEAQPERPKSNLDKKKKMLLLLAWSTLAIGLYLFFSRRFAITTVQVCELIVFWGLAAYLVNIFRIRSTNKKEPDNRAKLIRLENNGKYILIIILPLIFIILFDFLITSFKMFGK